MTLFPENKSELSIEIIAGTLSFFYEQAHLLHWQTTSIAEHQALGSFYSKLVDFKDEIVEKLMGYNDGKRVRAFKISSITDYSTGASLTLVKQVRDFANKLEKWASTKEYCDIENIAQGLSGEAAKTIYLLTLN